MENTSFYADLESLRDSLNVEIINLYNGTLKNDAGVLDIL
jgi:hypothetical protein